MTTTNPDTSINPHRCSSELSDLSRSHEIDKTDGHKHTTFQSSLVQTKKTERGRNKEVNNKNYRIELNGDIN